MAYSYKQQNAFQGTNEYITSMSCAYPGAVTAGSLLIAVVAWSSLDNETWTLSDSVGTNDTWAEIGTGLFSGTNNYGLRAYTLHNAAAGSSTILAASTIGSFLYGVLAIYEYSGIATANSLVGIAMNLQEGGTAPGTGTDAVTSGNTSTLTSQPALVFGAGLGWDVANSAIGSSYTTRGIAPSTNLWAGDKRVTATTAVSATFTVGTGDGANPHFTFVAAFAEAGGGGGAPIAALSFDNCNNVWQR